MPRNDDLVRKGKSKPEAQKSNGISFSELDLFDKKHPTGKTPEKSSAEKEGTKKAALLFQKAKEAVADFCDVMESVEAKSRVPQLEEIVDRFIDTLQSGDDLLIEAIGSKEESYDVIGHLVNVSILAIKMGIGLKLPGDELSRLGLAALMSDIGLLKVPKEILYASRKLSPEEFAEIRKHSEYVYEIIKGLGHEFLWLANTTHYIHARKDEIQNEEKDDNGYSPVREGGETYKHAEIIGLVDVYDAITHKRPHRKRKLHFDAIREIIDKEKKSFSKRLLKILIEQFTTYPVNTYVKLNTGEIAQVLETNRLSPLRPVIKIVINSTGEKVLSSKEVNLANTSLLYVIGPVMEESLSL